MEKKKIIALTIGVGLTAALLFVLHKFYKKHNASLKELGISAAETLGVGKVHNNHMKTFFDFHTKHTGDLAADMTAFTKEAEGGTVTAKTDNASKYSKVSAAEPVHTNIGITREVFDAYEKQLEYDNSYVNFLKMPADVWYKIFSHVYVAPFAGLTREPVINDMVAGWGWGSGVDTAKKSIKKFCVANNVAGLDELIGKIGAPAVFEKLVLWRMEFFKNISPKYNPTFEIINGKRKEYPGGKYTDGWLNREANFYNIFKDYLIL